MGGRFLKRVEASENANVLMNAINHDERGDSTQVGLRANLGGFTQMRSSFLLVI